MKVLNGDIWLAKPALEAVLQLPADQLSVKGKYWLAKLTRILSGPIKDIEQSRMKLVQQYGDKTETGYSVPPATAVPFMADFAEVLEIETDVRWEPVTLTDKDGEALTGGQMLLLDPFVTFLEPSGNSSNGADHAPLEAVK